MSCWHLRARWEELLAGGLSAEEEALLREHGASCPRCRGWLDRGGHSSGPTGRFEQGTPAAAPPREEPGGGATSPVPLSLAIAILLVFAAAITLISHGPARPFSGASSGPSALLTGLIGGDEAEPDCVCFEAMLTEAPFPAHAEDPVFW